MNFFNRGAILVEFVMLLPLLILLSFGFFELHRYITIDTYLRTAGYRLALWASQDKSASSLSAFITCLQNEGSAYSMSSSGTFIVTGIMTGNQATNTSITQLAKVGTDSTQITSTYPSLNSNAPNAIGTVVVEVVYNYVPIFYQLTSKTIRQTYCLDYRGQQTFP